MRLKLFRAATMVEAMSLVRGELGIEALILGTRRIAGGVEITAAVEAEMPSSDDPDPQPGSANEAETRAGAADVVSEAARSAAASFGRPRPQTDGLLPAKVCPPNPDPRREAALAWHGVPQSAARKLAVGPLPLALSIVLRFAPLNLATGARPLLLVGPAGAGKTLTTARLATRLVMAGQRPMVVTADAQRAGATEQLAAFTRLLGLNLLVASTPLALTRAIARREGGVPVLIDCPGIDAFDAAQLEEVASLAVSASGTMVLVLPGGLDPAEAADIAAAHRESGATMLVANRLDAARRLGGVVAAAATGLALAEAGIGAGAADGLTPMTPDLLAARLLQVPDRRP